MPNLKLKKPKLPTNFIWPIKRSDLDEQLKKIPQYEELNLWYSDRPLDNYCYSILKIYGGEIDYPILKGQYRFMSYGTARSISDAMSTKWHLNIYPIKSDLKVFITEQLLKYELPKLIKWYSLPKNDNWLESDKKFNIFLSHRNKNLYIGEENKC